MDNHFDFLIVGAGFAGAVLAERLNSIGKKVLVVEKRDHIGGNCYDFFDTNGVLVHKYGPHYFRTNIEEVKKYLSKFTKWRMHRYEIRTYVNKKIFPFPINLVTLNEFFNVNLKTEKEAKKFIESKRYKIKRISNAEEQVLALVGKEIYEAFFKNYTKKQWGIDPKRLDPSVTARIAIRTDNNYEYVNEKFQAMPLQGYHALFKNLLKDITVLLKTDFKDIKKKISYDNLIYTGPIDGFFDYKFGRLPYRSLRFKFEQYNKPFYQKWSQINYPNEYKFTRIVEIKHATGQKINKTTIVKEFPRLKGEPYYPIPSSKNRKLYLKYKKESEKLKNVYFVGRFSTYQYLNMDMVVKQALDIYKKIKKI